VQGAEARADLVPASRVTAEEAATLGGDDRHASPRGQGRCAQGRQPAVLVARKIAARDPRRPGHQEAGRSERDRGHLATAHAPELAVPSRHGGKGEGLHRVRGRVKRRLDLSREPRAEEGQAGGAEHDEEGEGQTEAAPGAHVASAGGDSTPTARESGTAPPNGRD
jgi:hypothetical protein